MRLYKEAHLREFTEWLFINRLKTMRLGPLFLVWGWEGKRVAVVAVRKSDKYIVRKKHRVMFSKLQDAIMNNCLQFCRWDPEEKLRVYSLANEPKWKGYFPKEEKAVKKQEEAVDNGE